MTRHTASPARHALAGLLLLGALAAPLYAAVPTTMNYQGYLTGADGHPRNGAYAMAFAIYADSLGGAALWSDGYASVPVSGGVFGLLLGAGTPLPASVFSGATRWLEIAVSDTVLAPRRPLVSVPYSFRTAVADSAARAPAGAGDSLWTSSGGDVYRMGGNVGIGTASPADRLEVAGTVRLTGLRLPTGATSGYVLTSDASGTGAWAPAVGQGAIGGGGSPYALARFTAPNAIGNSVMWESGGNIGIGTGGPSALLHVVSANPGSRGLIVQGAGGQIADLQQWNDYTGATRASIGASGVFTGSGAGLTGLNASNITTGVLPGAVLNGSYSNPVIFNNPSNSFAGTGTGLTNLNASNIVTGTLNPMALPSGGTWNLSSPLSFYHSGGLGLYLEPSARVGIGTNGPQGRLHVVTGSTGVRGVVVQGANGQSANLEEWQDYTGATRASVSATGVITGNGSGLTNLPAPQLSGYVPNSALGGTYSQPVYLQSGGNLFAGSGAGLSNLNASAITTGTLGSAFLPTSGNWPLSSSLNIGSNLLTLDRANGRIGIGTASPTKLLTIAASYSDYDITTSGTGNLDITTGAGSGAGITISAQENSTSGITVAANNWVGIGTVPSTILTIQQNSASDPIADSWGTYSSRRWKTNIVPIEDALGLVQRLQGVRYDLKATGRHDLGMIAEDVGRVVPEVVVYEDNGVDAKSVDYARLTALLVEAVKQLKGENEALTRRIEALEAKTARP